MVPVAGARQPRRPQGYTKTAPPPVTTHAGRAHSKEPIQMTPVTTQQITGPRAARAAFLAELPAQLFKQYRHGKPTEKQTKAVQAAWASWLQTNADNGRVSASAADTATL